MESTHRIRCATDGDSGHTDKIKVCLEWGGAGRKFCLPINIQANSLLKILF